MYEKGIARGVSQRDSVREKERTIKLSEAREA